MRFRILSVRMCLPAALTVALLAAPLYGNNELPKRAITPSHYNFAQEVTLKGTIQTISAKRAAYLSVATAKGIINAQVGASLLRGPNAVSFSPGEQVTLTGLLKTIGRQRVFLTRLIEANGRTITVRNQNGFFVSPAERLRLSRLATSGDAR